MKDDVQQTLETWDDIVLDDEVAVEPHFDPEKVAQGIDDWNLE